MSSNEIFLPFPCIVFDGTLKIHLFPGLTFECDFKTLTCTCFFLVAVYHIPIFLDYLYSCPTPSIADTPEMVKFSYEAAFKALAQDKPSIIHTHYNFDEFCRNFELNNERYMYQKTLRGDIQQNPYLIYKHYFLKGVEYPDYFGENTGKVVRRCYREMLKLGMIPPYKG